MPVFRRFLLAPSLARLIRKEIGWEQVIEGHFQPQSERQSYVRIQKDRAHLVLAAVGGGPETVEEITELPMAHAEALYQVCPGTLTVGRSVVPSQDRDTLVDGFVRPGSLDLVSIEFTNPVEAESFVPPVWFGAEVTQDEHYSNRVIALHGLPAIAHTEPSNVALEALLDILEGDDGRATSPTTTAGEIEPGDETTPSNRLFAAHQLSLRPASELQVVERTATAEVEATRSDLQDTSDDERLAGVIKGLSAALASTPKEGGAGVAAPPPRAWRRSSH